MGSCAVILMTGPDGDETAQIVKRLVEERLIACGNVVSGVRSIYRWDDALTDDREALAVLKCRLADVERVVARVNELHPYDLPEVIALPICGGSAKYLAWVGQETEPESTGG